LTSCGQAEPLPDDCTLLRLVENSERELEWHDDEGRWVPRVPSNALNFNVDLSLFWRGHLELCHGWTPDGLLRPTELVGKVVFQTSKLTLDSLNLNVSHTPNSEQPEGCAHCSAARPVGLNKFEKKSLSTKISRKMALAAGEIVLTKPEGA
jgi:hypothetical protein